MKPKNSKTNWVSVFENEFSFIFYSRSFIFIFKNFEIACFSIPRNRSGQKLKKLKSD